MKKLLGIVVLGLIACTISFAGITEKKEAPPFAFTADDKVKDFKENELIIKEKSSDIKTDEYWNKPLTKLDYVLMQFKKNADETTKNILKDKGGIYRYFDKLEHAKKYRSVTGQYGEYEVSNAVHFDEKSGKILVSFNITGLGKPKEPMSEICKKIMKYDLMFMPPQKMRGYTFHNRILNEIYRGDSYKNYNNHLEKIANNLVYVLSLSSRIATSETKADEDIFQMVCYKLNSEENYIIRKHSMGFVED